MRDISPPKGLKPRKEFFPEVGEDMINGDGIIRLMQMIDTPQAKAMYRVFRLAYSRIRGQEPGLPDEKAKNKALIEAINSGEKKINWINIDSPKETNK